MASPPAPSIDFGDLFSISEGFERGAIRVDDRDDVIDDGYALTRGDWKPDAPIVFVVDEGKREVDFVGTTWGVVWLVSERFVGVLRGGGFSGWATFPAEVQWKNGDPIPGYHGLVATGRSGPADYAKCEEVWVDPPVPEGKRTRSFRGFFFEPPSWDGSDVFIPDETGAIVITGDVRRGLDAAGVTNVNYRRLSDMTMDLTHDKIVAAGFDPDPPR